MAPFLIVITDTWIKLSRLNYLIYFQPQPAEERLTPSTGKFEGDILLTPEEEKEMKEADKNVGKRGVGRATYGYRWPGNKVYYKLSRSCE